jgi:DNA-directed RNA polymerase subunit RPC12/RpoP
VAVLQQYKCPCCDGAIEFDSSLQKMKCPYCDTEFDVDTLRSYDDDLKNEQEGNMNWETAAGGQWQEGEAEGLRVYSCQACGGEIVADETTAATSCPFCGNPVVMMGQFSGALKPDFVIPFKYDKKQAVEALKKHYCGKRLLPKIFADQNHIDEVKGVYVPVWLFDADADANIRYRATRVRHWSDSNYYYTETSFYSVRRGGSISFERVPVDGSTKMDDTLMESIEPYDFSEAVDFQTAYLSGYLADKYDVDSEQSIDRANERIKKSTEDAFASTVRGYTTVRAESGSVNLQNGVAKYALYPVWLLNTSWEGKKYTFAMNGQTGKFVGNLPLDKAAYRRWLFGIAAAVSAVAFAASYLLWLL